MRRMFVLSRDLRGTPKPDYHFDSDPVGVGVGVTRKEIFGVGIGVNSKEIFGVGIGVNSKEIFGVGIGVNSKEIFGVGVGVRKVVSADL